MSLRKIRTYGDSVLRGEAERIDEITPDLQTLIDDMIDTMLKEPGIGLAAPQVGVSKRLMIVMFGLDEEISTPVALINPEITWHGEETAVAEEGCLSVPEITGNVTRWSELEFTATDRQGTDLKMTVKGITARIIQHELDHLNGVLFVDRLTPIKREFVKKKLKKRLKKESG